MLTRIPRAFKMSAAVFAEEFSAEDAFFRRDEARSRDQSIDRSIDLAGERTRGSPAARSFARMRRDDGESEIGK